MTDLLVLAEAQIAEKQVKEIEAIKERLASDKEVLKEAIALLIHTHYIKEKVIQEVVINMFLLQKKCLKLIILENPNNSHIRA